MPAMRALYRSLLIALLLLPAALWPCRSAPADRAFSAATNALKDGFFARAESELGDFARTYTNSPLLAQAILYQAEARWSVQNYDGAFQLLSAHQSKAGKWADEYLFWIGESLFRKGEFARAAESFAKITREFPASSRSLEAVIGEASARMRLGDYQRVVQVFQQANSVFQNAALTNSASELVPRGYLLLAEA